MASSQSVFTPKEQREIEELEQAKKNPKLSKIEQQIAEAKLQDIRASKASPPHVHKHRFTGALEEEGPETNMFRNDEAFERFEMGGEKHHEKGSKVRNQAEGDYLSVKHNHKTKGTTKEKADEILHLPEA
ncbi:hypothetical protein M413DRAFT_445468 [Hebeloma cylindrosporum]|uniref:Uncharacterized protein n=1 Tax=Hebeloma cylindrosporum TaxID=76867 RepID=A0A0C3BY11_HEBCY|nr:hypothetical protein M413DRAFT_445468 [Hebeloma cylindrosporum h7]